MTDVQTMDTTIDRAQAGTRFDLLLIGVFAMIAALLAAVGLYGVVGSAVRQRTAEIGLRIAFGAEPSGVVRLMIGQGLTLGAVGIGIGRHAHPRPDQHACRNPANGSHDLCNDECAVFPGYRRRLLGPGTTCRWH